MKTKTQIAHTFLFTATLAAVFISAPASSANLCKGLESNACTTNLSCGWVEGYERKDGRKVKSFCRSKPSAKKQVVDGKSSKVSKKAS